MKIINICIITIILLKQLPKNAMYACLCKGVTDTQICSALQPGARSLRDAHTSLGVACRIAGSGISVAQGARRVLTGTRWAVGGGRWAVELDGARCAPYVTQTGRVRTAHHPSHNTHRKQPLMPKPPDTTVQKTAGCASRTIHKRRPSAIRHATAPKTPQLSAG